MRIFALLIFIYSWPVQAQIPQSERELLHLILNKNGINQQKIEELKESAALEILFYRNEMVAGQLPPELSVYDEELYLDLKRNRRIHQLRLTNPDYEATKSLGFTMSLPEDFDEKKKYPVIFILPGFTSEKNVTAYIEEPGQVIIVGMDYPFQNIEPNYFLRPEAFVKDSFKVVAQASAALAWLQERPYVDRRKVNLMGVSLGGILLPAVKNYAKNQGVLVNASIISHSAINLEQVLTADLEMYAGKREAEILSRTLSIALEPFNPERHASQTSGPYLFIYSDDDQLFPVKYATAYFDKLPGPKEAKVISGGHVNVSRPEVIDQVVETSKAWLRSQGAL